MKIDSIRKVITVLKVVAPEYKDMPEENLKVWIELAEPYVSENKFGCLYYNALAYLTAHKLSLNTPAKQGEETTSVKSTMHVASYAEGSTNISFNNPAASGSADADAEYLLTAYGLQYLSIRKQCIIPITISGMRRK